MKNIIDAALFLNSLSDSLGYDPYWLALRARKQKCTAGKLRINRPQQLLRELVREVVAEAMQTGRLHVEQILEDAGKRVAANNAADNMKLKFPTVKVVEAVLSSFPKADVIRARDGDEAADLYLRLQELRSKYLH